MRSDTRYGLAAGSTQDLLPQYIVPRVAYLDRVRGLAVLLMVVDHFLIFTGYDHSVWRLTVTRAALPLFCILAGMLYRRLNWSRLIEVVTAGLLSGFLALYGNKVGQPDICILLAMGIMLLPWLTQPLAIILWILQPVTWRIGWTAYQPGTVFLLLVLGYQLRHELTFFRWGSALPSAFEILGKYPLSFYIGHIVLLTLFTV